MPLPNKQELTMLFGDEAKLCYELYCRGNMSLGLPCRGNFECWVSIFDAAACRITLGINKEDHQGETRELLSGGVSVQRQILTSSRIPAPAATLQECRHCLVCIMPESNGSARHKLPGASNTEPVLQCPLRLANGRRTDT